MIILEIIQDWLVFFLSSIDSILDFTSILVQTKSNNITNQANDLIVTNIVSADESQFSFTWFYVKTLVILIAISLVLYIFFKLLRKNIDKKTDNDDVFF